MMSSPRIILASQSYSRQRLVAMAGIEAETIPSNFDEYAVQLGDFPSKEDYVATIAAGKLLDVANEHVTDNHTYLVGGDLVVFVDDTPFFKPTSLTEAKEYMRILGGRTHEELCATAFWSPQNGVDVVTESVMVTVPQLTETEIENYVATADPLSKAAGFSIMTIQNILRQRAPQESCIVDGSITALLGISLPAVENFFIQHHLNFPTSAQQLEDTLTQEIMYGENT